MDPGLRVGGVAAFFSLCLRCSGVDTLATLLLSKLPSYVEKCMRQEAAYKSQCGETLAGALIMELVTVNYPLKELPSTVCYRYKVLRHLCNCKYLSMMAARP